MWGSSEFGGEGYLQGRKGKRSVGAAYFEGIFSQQRLWHRTLRLFQKIFCFIRNVLSGDVAEKNRFGGTLAPVGPIVGKRLAVLVW